MARENSKLGSNPGRYSGGIRAKVAAVWIPNCDCFMVFWLWKENCPMVSEFVLILKGQNELNLVK